MFRPLRTFWLASVPALALSCHVAPPPSEPWDSLSPDQRRQRVVDDARLFLKSGRLDTSGRRFPYDCSGMVAAALYRSGIDVFHGASVLQMRGNGVKLIHEFVRRYGEIRQDSALPGDVVFLSDTYDRNGDGKFNDPLTHVGIVESVDPDGTVTFISHLHRGIRREILNVAHPTRGKDPEGKVLNTPLRRRSRRDPPGVSYLAGSLFSGFGRLLPDSSPPSPSPVP